MAIVRMNPVPVHVSTGWFDGRPRSVTWHQQKLAVTRVTVVRDEASAYPLSLGPRTVFEVETPEARLALTFQHRSRRWTLDGIEEAMPA